MKENFHRTPPSHPTIYQNLHTHALPPSLLMDELSVCPAKANPSLLHQIPSPLQLQDYIVLSSLNSPNFHSLLDYSHNTYKLSKISQANKLDVIYSILTSKYSLWPQFPCQLRPHVSELLNGKTSLKSCLNSLFQIPLLFHKPTRVEPSPLPFHQTVLVKVPNDPGQFAALIPLAPSAAADPVDRSLLNTLSSPHSRGPHS